MAILDLCLFSPQCNTMSDLELGCEEAAEWFSEMREAMSGGERFKYLNCRRPRLHLLLGDSIAIKAAVASRFDNDGMLCRAQSGDTWQKLLGHLESDIVVWQLQAAASGLLPGSVVVWMSGNDVYSRLTGLAQIDREHLDSVGLAARTVVSRLKGLADRVYLLGPLPRVAGELRGTTWEATAAYHLERTLLWLNLGDSVQLVPSGRQLTRKMGRRRHGIQNTEAWYTEDGVHLSKEGYEKLADASSLPMWITLKAAK